MSRSLIHHPTGRSLASYVLLAFVVRSLIPAGFMPDAVRPFALEICPDGFAVQLLPNQSIAHSGHAGHEMPGIAHDRVSAKSGTSDPSGAGSHDHNSWRSHCVFASVASAPPVSDAAAPSPVPEATHLTVYDTDPRVTTAERFRIAQPRAPPFLAN